jgi:hypothetical protein
VEIPAGSGGPAVIVAFNAFGDPFKKRLFLGVKDHFGFTVRDGPTASATGALMDIFIESVDVQIDFLSFGVFADRTMHDRLLSSSG